MIGLFKNFGFSAVFGLIIVLLIIRLPMLFAGIPVTIPEVELSVIGEKMSRGFVLYRDIVTAEGPLSAGFYYLLIKTGILSSTSLKIISILFIYLQALLFNLLLNFNSVLREKSMIPSLIYVVFGSMFFDFYTVTPLLLAMPFLILAVHYVLLQIKTSERDEFMFYTGAMVGIAALFYPFVSVFLPFVLIIMVVGQTKGVSPKKYLLIPAGFTFPILVTFIWFFCKEGAIEFTEYFLLQIFRHERHSLVPFGDLMVLLLVPAGLLICAFYMITTRSRFINYQYLAIRIFILWLIAGLISLFLVYHREPADLFIFVPPLAFFGAHYFNLLKGFTIKEISFAVLFLLTCLISYGSLFGYILNEEPIHFKKLIISEEEEEENPYKGKKILVLGDSTSLYNKNSLGSPFFDWSISKKELNSISGYESTADFYSRFSTDLPEIIIDKEKLVPRLFSRIPAFQNNYEQQQPGVYYLKNKQPSASVAD